MVNQEKRSKSQINNIVMVFIGIIIGVVLGVLITARVLDKENKLDTINSVETELGQQEQVQSTLEQMLEEKSIAIETPIVNLYYPEKWKEQIRIEQVEGDEYTVQFYGTIKGKSEVQIFDIVFGGKSEGILLGRLDEIEVYLNYSDPFFDEKWSEEEKDEFYAMQEDVNYVLGMLKKEDRFIPVSGVR